MLILFGLVNFIFAAFAFGLEFMADSVSFMFLYLWSRKHPDMEVNFFDVFIFRSCYMTYFYLIMTFLCGFTPVNQIIGCVVGHLYFFLEDVVPRIPET
jgi:Derlin-2/3